MELVLWLSQKETFQPFEWMWKETGQGKQRAIPKWKPQKGRSKFFTTAMASHSTDHLVFCFRFSAGIQFRPILPQPRPSCFAGIWIFFGSKTNGLPRGSGSGIALVADQRVVFTAGPWAKAMIDGWRWWQSRVTGWLPGTRGRSGEGDGRGRPEAEATGFVTAAGGGLALGLTGRLRWSESDSSVVGTSVGWPPIGVRAEAVMLVGVDSEAATWTRCFFWGRASGLTGGLSALGLGEASRVVESIGKCAGFEDSPRLDLDRAVFDGQVFSGGRMDRGRTLGSGFKIMCDGMPPCDARVGLAGDDGTGAKVWRWRPAWGGRGVERGYDGVLRYWSAWWSSLSTVGSKNGKNQAIQFRCMMALAKW